jgi:hypothetical protein
MASNRLSKRSAHGRIFLVLLAIARHGRKLLLCLVYLILGCGFGGIPAALIHQAKNLVGDIVLLSQNRHHCVPDTLASTFIGIVIITIGKMLLSGKNVGDHFLIVIITDHFKPP